MKFLVLSFLMFFDFFHKKKVLKGLKCLIKRNDGIIFDVGAHHGESIILFKNNLGFSKIYSFEPLHNNFLKLIKNTKNLKQDLLCFDFALGEKKENKIIKEMSETSSSTFNSLNENSKYYKRKKNLLGIKKESKMYEEKIVSIEKASNIIKKFNIVEIDLLKIDTEGYEYYILKFKLKTI